MNNFKILSYVLLTILFYSCERKPVIIEPIIEPIVTNKFIFDTTASGSLVSIRYDINANVFLGVKLSSLKSNTDIKIDWGDNEIQMVLIDTSSTRSSDLFFVFTHEYKENNKYFVKLVAKNAIVKDSLTTTVNIVNKVPKPVADFDFQLLEGGKVKLKNLSSSKDNLVQFQWGDNQTINRSISRDAEFIYEINGIYTISLRVFDSVGQSEFITKKITITNAINRELSEFKGTIFGKNYEFIENLSDCVSGTTLIDPAQTSVIKFLGKSLPEQRISVSVLGMFKIPTLGENITSKQYEIFKNNLTLGVKKVGNRDRKSVV